MPRIARVVAAGYPHHITQRGDYQQKIFADNPDEMKGIRKKTRTAWPLGTNDFIERLEGQLKRLFKLKQKGRPKKKVDK